MPPKVILYSSNTAGYALDDSGDGSNFGELYSDGKVISVAAIDPNIEGTIYGFAADGQTFLRSIDNGANWDIVTNSAWPASANVTDMFVNPDGDIFAFQTLSSGSHAGYQGIWRSTDAGDSWTHIVTMPNADQAGRGGGIACGTTKIWYAESNTTLVSGSLPADKATFAIKTCNWDGSSITTINSINYDRTGGTAASRVKVYAIDDLFCLTCDIDPAVIGSNNLWLFNADGSTEDATLGTSVRVWDVLVFSKAVLVALATSSSTPVNAVRVWRSTNSGWTWSLRQTITDTEGFAINGSKGKVLASINPKNMTQAYMWGYASSSVRQYIWRSTDAGYSWVSFRNNDELTNGGGNYLDLGVGGVLAIPIEQTFVQPDFYLYSNETGGYALNASGQGYNFDELEVANDTAAFAAKVVSAPNYLYTVGWFEDRTFARTDDCGQNWTIWTMSSWPTNTQISQITAHAIDDLHVFQQECAGASAGRKGIWRSTNGGTTWTQVVTLANTFETRGGQLASGASKLWYGECTSYTTSPASTTFAIKTCNWDGSSVTTVASITYSGSVFGLKLRPWGDDFCLVLSPALSQMHKVTAAGSVTDIRPSALTKPWDVAIFSSSVYAACGQNTVSGTEPSYIHRTTDGGSSWTQVQSLPVNEGFAQIGVYDVYVTDVVPGSSTNAYMMGHSSSSVQQILWKTTDGGSTWVKFNNLAQLKDSYGQPLDYGTVGVLALGTPVAAGRGYVNLIA